MNECQTVALTGDIRALYFIKFSSSTFYDNIIAFLLFLFLLRGLGVAIYTEWENFNPIDIPDPFVLTPPHNYSTIDYQVIVSTRHATREKNEGILQTSIYIIRVKMKACDANWTRPKSLPHNLR